MAKLFLFPRNQWVNTAILPKIVKNINQIIPNGGDNLRLNFPSVSAIV